MANEITAYSGPPTLETYDPNWGARWETIDQELQRTRKEMEGMSLADSRHASAQQLADDLNHQLLDAFHAQFRTAADYKAWSLEKLKEKADRCRKVLILPDLPNDATVPQIREWIANGYEMIEGQDYRRLPVGQPEGVQAFQSKLPLNATRVTFYLSYETLGRFYDARVTIEQTQRQAFVCFHHIPDSISMTPTNAIERNATVIRTTLLPHLKTENITFFIHVPSAAGGLLLGEKFSKVDMHWSGDSYTSPQWTHYKVVPPAIREAEIKPYEEPPWCEKEPAPIHPGSYSGGRLATFGNWLKKKIL
ncbi:MAG: hypothetical protein SFW62_09630 [Alphaproteobacteria bacterium]|nr:hypothetical protein [Alphaproteobacteria bacterium]